MGRSVLSLQYRAVRLTTTVALAAPGRLAAATLLQISLLPGIRWTCCDATDAGAILEPNVYKQPKETCPRLI